MEPPFTEYGDDSEEEAPIQFKASTQNIGVSKAFMYFDDIVDIELRATIYTYNIIYIEI